MADNKKNDKGYIQHVQDIHHRIKKHEFMQLKTWFLWCLCFGSCIQRALVLLMSLVIQLQQLLFFPSKKTWLVKLDICYHYTLFNYRTRIILIQWNIWLDGYSPVTTVWVVSFITHNVEHHKSTVLTWTWSHAETNTAERIIAQQFTSASYWGGKVSNFTFHSPGC